MEPNQHFYCGVQCVVFRERASRVPAVLLGRRFRTAGEGQWSLPGGHVELNETPIMTARRELKEETGLTGENANLGAAFFTYTTDVPYAHVPVIFDAVVGQPELIPDERFSELDFFRLDRLPRPLFEPSRLTLSGLEQRPTIHAHFSSEGKSSFLKIDMASLEPDANRNNFYAIIFLWDGKCASVISMWGRRDLSGQQTHRSEYDDLDEGLRRLEEAIRNRVKRHYFVTGVSGDFTIDRLHAILPDVGGMQVVSESLIRRLLRDEEFRQFFSRDFYLYRPSLSRVHDSAYQETLF
jgi:8-oxo-dGTP diphosphatase